MGGAQALGPGQRVAAHAFQPAEEQKLRHRQPQHKGHPHDVEQPPRADTAHGVGRQKDHGPHQHKGDGRARPGAAERAVRQGPALRQAAQRQRQQRQQAQQRHVQPADPLQRRQHKTFGHRLGKAGLRQAAGAHLGAGRRDVDEQPRRRGGQRRAGPEIAPPRAQRRGQRQHQQVHDGDDLVPAADDKPQQRTARSQRSAPPARRLRQRQHKGQRGVEHRQRKVRLVVHGAVEPVQPFDRGGHALHKGVQQQHRQRRRQILLLRRQGAHRQARRAVQARQQRRQHAQQRQAVPLVAKNGRLQRQHKAGDIQPLPVVEIIDVGVPRGGQQARQVQPVLLHDGMGAGGVDIIIGRRARVKRQDHHRQQQNRRQQKEPAQPALLRRGVLPEPGVGALFFHTVTGCPGSSAGNRPTVFPTRASRARHRCPRYRRWGGCPCSPKSLAAPWWRRADPPPTRPGRSTG